MSTMCSTASKPFAFKVFPVETKSTIASLKPTSGASSIEPYSLIMSTWTPLASKMRCRDFRILRGNLQTASGLRSGFVIKPFTHSNHHAALGNLQIQRPVKPRAAVFDQHVFARNAEVRRAVADISRHIGCADNDKADVFMVRPDNQLARFFGLFSRSNA